MKNKHKKKSYKRNIPIWNKLEQFKSKDELIIYELFRSKGLNPKWQYQIDRYIADFVFEDKKVIIELNGGIHKRFIKGKRIIKTLTYESKGWMVINVNYNDIEDDWENIKFKILKICILLKNKS